VFDFVALPRAVILNFLEHLRCVVIARGRDAADVAISTQFGNAWLTRFAVVTEEVESREYEAAA
jgi:hypothetical protein